jgi:hypothetical protein
MRLLTVAARTVGIGAALALSFAVASAQVVEMDPTRLHVSRAQLTELLDFYEQSVASPVYSDRLKERARFEGQNVRSRLEGGDFQVGDRVVVDVEGESGLSDTLTVTTNHTLRLGELGEVDVTGVLRSELEPLLRQYVERYVRSPVVQSRSLIRVQMDGAVAQPGFFTMPAETPLPDAIMVAGGLTGQSKLNGIRIQRRGQNIMGGEMIQEALAQGRTLDQLSMQNGDRIFVPRINTSVLTSTLAIVSMVLGITVTAMVIAGIGPWQ